jgi:anhydro-N-acetylmuramic acid kinase
MYYLGLISGTSVDGIDAALASGGEQGLLQLHTHHHHPYPAGIREQILGLTLPGANEIERMGELDMRLGQEFADASLALLKKASIAPDEVAAIGSHGQTIRHHHGTSVRYTVQIGNAATIAARTGIPTVADFRSGDLAVRGEGAPLVPAFHQAQFRSTQSNRAIVNIGGIANVTHLPRDPTAAVVGFDTGPGNTLMDRWITQHRQKDYDAGGEWGLTGKPLAQLLDRLLADPYFDRPAPKSTGQERFNLPWLEAALSELKTAPAPEDVQATLVRLTAVSIARALRSLASRPDEVFVCGGGVHNPALMEQLSTELADASVETTAALGLDPDWVEAMAFAWLARERLAKRPGNVVAVTGAKCPAILGAIYAPPFRD